MARLDSHIGRVLVIHKKVPTRARAVTRKGCNAEREANDHAMTLRHARELFRKWGISAVFRMRCERSVADSAELVVTLGGDGTLLRASHVVGSRTPMVGINSAPKQSIGYLCAGDKTSLEETLLYALRGQLSVTELTRMQVHVDGKCVSSRVLNDILFCHPCPAATSRYTISLHGKHEEQRSSGLWVGPAAGSTAAQKSAGGQVFGVGSANLQFVVREPYDPHHANYSLLSGFVEPHESLRIQSRMPEGRIFIDGPGHEHKVKFGAEIALKRSEEPLRLLGLKRRD